MAADHLMTAHKELNAGGPGSGRHKEFDNVLKPEKGWQRESKRRQNFWDNRGGLKTVYKRADPRPGYKKGEQQVRVADDGHWEHVSHTSHVIQEGNGAEKLKEHLSSIPGTGIHSGIDARDFSQSRRKKLAKSGAAMPGGGFPIVNKQDLSNARQAIGRAKNPTAARAHIRERAKALHVKLSDKWQTKKSMKADQFSPADRLTMPKQAGIPDRDPAEYMPGKIQGAALIRQRPGHTYADPRRRVGSVMKGSKILP